MALENTHELRNFSAEDEDTKILQADSAKSTAQANMEFPDPAPRDDLNNEIIASREIDASAERPVTPTRTLNELPKHRPMTLEEFEGLQNASQTSVSQFDSSPAQFAGSFAPHPSHGTSTQSSPRPSLRSARSLRNEQEQEQEQRTVGYLHANGLELASTRSSTDSMLTSTSRGTTLTTKINRQLDIMANSQDETTTSTIFPERPLSPAHGPSVSTEEVRAAVTASRTRRAMAKMRIRGLDRRSTDDDATASTSNRDVLEASASFRAQRTREASNWFSGARASKSLPRRLEPHEGLQDPSRPSKSGSLRGQSSRSASFRLRNDRLPPAYILPTQETPHVVNSVTLLDHETVDERIPHGNLSLFPSLSSPVRLTAAPLIPDPDEDAPIPAPLNVAQRPPPDLTIDTTMSGTLSGSGEGSNRGSRFNEVLGEVDGGTRPDVPPKSPDRPSARNGALLSNRGSVVFPVPEPSPGPDAPPTKPVEPKTIPWMSGGVFAMVWLIVTALTLFGVWRTSRLSPPPACTSEQIQTCTPPSLSFVHTLRLNTTLPRVLQPYLSSLQLNDIEDLTLTDHGIEVSIQSGTDPLEVRGGLTMGTSLADDKVSVLSDIRYAGVIDGDGDSRMAKKRLGEMMKQAGHGNEHNGKIVKVVSAQGASREVTISKDGDSIGKVFLALWLACLLAAEIALLIYFWLLPLLRGVVLWMASFYWAKKEDGVVKGGEKSRKKAVLTASGLALRWVLAGALGAAAASGILIAFRT